MTKPQDMNGFDDDTPAMQPVQESSDQIMDRLKKSRATPDNPQSTDTPQANAYVQAQVARMNTETAVKGGNWFPVKGLPSGRTDYIGRPLTYKEIKKLSYANEDTIDEALVSIAKDAVQSDRKSVV